MCSHKNAIVLCERTLDKDLNIVDPTDKNGHIEYKGPDDNNGNSSDSTGNSSSPGSEDYLDIYDPIVVVPIPNIPITIPGTVPMPMPLPIF